MLNRKRTPEEVEEEYILENPGKINQKLDFGQLLKMINSEYRSDCLEIASELDNFIQHLSLYHSQVDLGESDSRTFRNGLCDLYQLRDIFQKMEVKNEVTQGKEESHA